MEPPGAGSAAAGQPQLDDPSRLGLVRDAETRGYFFTDEIPAVNRWTLPPTAAAQLEAPVLLVQGGASPPPVHRLISHLAGLIPHATIATIAGADHLLPLTRPAQLARTIADHCRPEATVIR